MLTIGIHFRGPELKHTDTGQVLIRTVKVVAELCGDVIGGKDTNDVHGYQSKGTTFVLGSSPLLNVMFYVPGSLGDFPRLAAPTAGKFSRKLQEVLVEVYVPKEQVASGRSVEFVIEALRKSCAVAADVFEKKKAGPFDLAMANAIIDRVRDALLEKSA